MRRLLLLLLLLLVLPVRADDMYIVPGQRVGPITAHTTWGDLVALYGSHVQKRNVTLNDGTIKAGAVVNLQLERERVDLIFRPNGTVMLAILNGSESDWETMSGIKLGSTVADVERANGGPFELYGFGWEFGGLVTSWKDGLLGQTPGLAVSFTDGDGNGLMKNELEGLRGERRIPSDDPLLRMLNPKVVQLTVNLGPPE